MSKRTKKEETSEAAIPPQEATEGLAEYSDIHKEDDPSEFFSTHIAQIERAYKTIEVAPHVRTILGQPKNEIIVNFPVRTDAGEFRLFTGYRIQHNNALGPYKGGFRYHEDGDFLVIVLLHWVMTYL